MALTERTARARAVVVFPYAGYIRTLRIVCFHIRHPGHYHYSSLRLPEGKTEADDESR